jgi:cold shock CspA family protein
MEISDPLLEQVRSGRVVLFIGAGANSDSHRPDGTSPPLGDQLRTALSTHFLGGKHANEPLAWVSELAISASNLFDVQDFIAKQFEALVPAEYHLLFPTFRWRGIATTNYDRLIEEVYLQTPKAIQIPIPFISNHDRVDEKLRSPEHVGLVKLHGCVTRTHDPDLPLILTTDQYVTHRRNRDRLFKIFQEWAVENTVVFVGHAVQDSDIRTILLELSKELTSRPRYYIVKPNVTDVERDFWGEKRISVLSGTFEQFLRALDSAIIPQMRVLARAIDTDHPICRHFAVREPLSTSLRTALEQDLEYVHEGLQYEQGSPDQFYKGFDFGWYPVLENLDVRRELTDSLIYEVILRPEADRPTQTELYVIRAEAGAGKTIFLKRLAWETAVGGDVICLVLRPGAITSIDTLREIHRYTKKRLFVFVDDAADNVSLLLSIMRGARQEKLPITLITAERLNEWNIACEDLAGYVSEYYSLPYLNSSEIEVLVKLLQKHNSLGPNLRGKLLAEQIREFEERAGRQLLVALHEATLGKPFEETLMDEYLHIVPERAQRLYLTVCILNRLNVPVRAGFIARLEGISFEQFGKEFLGPLEHVVIVKGRTGPRSHVETAKSRQTRGNTTGFEIGFTDYAYAARHPEIAQIVFERILTDPTDRFNEYVRIIGKLNLAFSSDLKLFRKLIRAKSLHELFPDYEMVKAIYDAAQELIGPDAPLYQQMANYERVRPNGNLDTARIMLQKAIEMEPSNATVVHTLGEVLRAESQRADKLLKRNGLRQEARVILTKIQGDPVAGRYAKVTLVRLGMDELEDLLSEETSNDRSIEEAIRAVERLFLTFKQEFPQDPYLLNAEADFRRVLHDHDRSFIALRAAFDANPRDPYTASKLADLYQERGDLQSGRQCLHEALQRNGADKQLNYRYAHLLRATEPAQIDRLAYHFRRAFSEGDDNYEAQFWYARYAFESPQKDVRHESKEIFRRLREVPMEHKVRIKIHDVIGNGGQHSVFTGTVERLELRHGFLRVDGTGDSLFIHSDDVDLAVWKNLSVGDRVAFNIGFAYGGAQALKVRSI